jgi:hypothetical protein
MLTREDIVSLPQACVKTVNSPRTRATCYSTASHLSAFHASLHLGFMKIGASVFQTRRMKRFCRKTAARKKPEADRRSESKTRKSLVCLKAFLREYCNLNASAQPHSTDVRRF